MSILKLTPSCKDYLWGGSRLRTDFGVQSAFLPSRWPQLSAGWHHIGGLPGRPPGSGGNRLQKV